MPKISAATVTEHRANQRSALVAAATSLLVNGGVSAVTPAAVGAAAGLSRPSVYQYFDSGAAIVAAIIEDAFPPANAALAAALADKDEPRERINVYVRETLALAAAGSHRPAAALRGATLTDSCRARIAELHREQAAPFIAALAALGVPELAITSRLLGGMIESAMDAVEAGADLDAVTARTLALVYASAESPSSTP